MNRFTHACLAFAFALVVVGCDKQGVYPYGRRTDVIDACGTPSSVHLRSSASGTDMLILGTASPGAASSKSAHRCMLVGTVDRNSSTRLLYGYYELDGSGDGFFYVTAEYYYSHRPDQNIGARAGSERTDTDPEFYFDPIRITSAGDQTTLEYLGETRTYTAYESVANNLDINAPEGPADLYQLYNLALFFSQVRIPAFGSLGMTRYVTATGRFGGLVSGGYTVSVRSNFDPVTTISYDTLEDFPLVNVTGDQVTSVDLQANGTMRGALTFSIGSTTSPGTVLFAGNVDYTGVTITNGVATAGNYIVNVTSPITVSAPVPFSAAYDVDLRNFLPESP